MIEIHLADGGTLEVTEEVAAGDAADAKAPATPRRRFQLVFEAMESSAYDPHARLAAIIKFARRQEHFRLVTMDEVAPVAQKDAA